MLMFRLKKTPMLMLMLSGRSKELALTSRAPLTSYQVTSGRMLRKAPIMTVAAVFLALPRDEINLSYTDIGMPGYGQFTSMLMLMSSGRSKELALPSRAPIASLP